MNYPVFSRVLRLCIFIGIFVLSNSLLAQTLGGNSVYNFLKMPNTPQLSALGGVNLTQPSADVGLAFYNPAQWQPSMHTQLNTVFNSHYAGIKAYHISLGYRHAPLRTNFTWGLQYFDYGNTVQTDAAGNVLGSFRPLDWVMQLTASRSYLQKWQYGLALKYIHSAYGPYRSDGLAADVGLLYRDTARLFYASVVARNMGTQLREYPGAGAEDLPFDLQVGVTQRMAQAPFGISLTGQRMHRLDIRYEDTSFNNGNGFPNSSRKKWTAGKLLDHLVLAATVYIGDRVEFQAGYNFLRRRELNIGVEGNGLNGLSLGAGVKLGKLDIRYARSYYQAGSAYNQFGLNLSLREYFGLGRFGQRIGW